MRLYVFLIIFSLVYSNCITYRSFELPNDQKLVKAAEEGNLNEVKRLIEAGVDIESETHGVTALKQATYECHVEIIDYLIKAGADVNNGGSYYDYRPIRGAVLCENVEAIELLLKAGADPNFRGSFTAVTVVTAMTYDNYQAVDLLLRYGANPTIKAGNGDSVIELIKQEKYKPYRYLVERALQEKRWLATPIQDPKPFY